MPPQFFYESTMPSSQPPSTFTGLLKQNISPPITVWDSLKWIAIVGAGFWVLNKFVKGHGK